MLRPARYGFTLVELLVVIAIIGMLMSLLLPAVNSARESGRRTVCANNLHNLALACRAFESQRRSFPAAITVLHTVDSKGNPTTSWEDPTATRRFGANWVIDILPYLDNQALWDQFDLTLPISDKANRDPRGTQLGFMICPSDSGANLKFSNIDKNGKDKGDGDNWARGNYGANGTLDYLSNSVGSTAGIWQNRFSRGVMGVNIGASLDEVKDGASRTIMLGELRMGQLEIDRRGVWAMASVGSSACFGHGEEDANGPNSLYANSDDILDGKDILAAYGDAYGSGADAGSETLRRMKFGIWTGSTNGTQVNMRSMHAGGINTAFCDGSTHFISDSIERASDMWLIQNLGKGTGDQNDFRVWERLLGSIDGMPIDDTQY